MITEERQLNVAQMDVFSRLMQDRIIYLGTQIDDYTANVIIAQLLFLQSSNPDIDIKIYINSPGGEVNSGLAIYDTMQYINNNVSTLATGMAASMASIILCAGTKGKRGALPHSRVMIHQPLGGVRGQATDMEIAVNEIKKLKHELYEILTANSNKTYDEIYELCERDTYLTAAEALEYEMIDTIYYPSDKKKTES